MLFFSGSSLRCSRTVCSVQCHRENGSIISLVKRKKTLSTQGKAHSRSWLRNTPRPGFQGYPIATVAFYGPTNKLATKVAVSIILTENNQPDFLERWFSEGEMDVRNDAAIGEQVMAFLKAHAPRSTVVADRIIGCPHEEGTDYPDGTSCPQCHLLGRPRPLHARAHSVTGELVGGMPDLCKCRGTRQKAQRMGHRQGSGTRPIGI